MRSLRARLLLITSLLLAGALAVVGAILDSSVRAALDEEQRELLDSQIITLLAVAEPDEGERLRLPYDLPDQRFNTPDSGFYAKVRDRSGAFLWRSVSAVDLTFTPDTPLPAPGERVFARSVTSTGDMLLTLTLGIIWTFEDGSERYFALSAAESERAIIGPLKKFRGRMFAVFALVAGVLLVGMGLVLSWLLRPLGQIAAEIADLETGVRTSLSDHYPSELSGVARNLNTLMKSEQRRTSRYQQTLANLAHSLKTPLAAAKALLDDGTTKPELQAQMQRMEQIVRYQLARPAIGTGRTVGNRTLIEPEITQILGALDKVYREKGVYAEIDFEHDMVFPGDRGDLVEMLGNLLDNAYKWTTNRVLVAGRKVTHATGSVIELSVEDDGAGFPEEAAAAALKRGTRLDETVPGTGIGLAVVAELVEQYEGKVAIERSRLNGARVVITLPLS
ncbi:MAG: ATP-binding protein [Pseudomonadota bacterium]